MKYSLMFFSSGDGSSAAAALKQITSLTRFADDNGLHRIWLPERHFVQLGSLHPNPAVLAAAVAAQTKRVRIGAGSVVAPLHDPLRICEEWSQVDNLSDGRIDMALASGWRAKDFALAPDNYAERHAVLEQRISEVRRLWSGHALERRDGEGRVYPVHTLPRPVQAELPLWVTATRNAQTFEMAGRVGANLLTYLVDLGVDGLEQQLNIYRQARAKAGHSGPGIVTVMLHTFLGEDTRQVRQQIEPYYHRYLVNNSDLLGRPGVATAALTASDAHALASAQFDRIYERLSLMGGIQQCRALVHQLEDLGVDEIACLIDFVDDWQLIHDALPALLMLADQTALTPIQVKPHRDASARTLPPLLSASQGEFYAHIDSLGGHYGPQFQWVQSVTVSETEARSRLAVPPAADPAAWRAQLMDAAVSTAHAIGMQPGLRASSRPLALPVAVGTIRFAPGSAAPSVGGPTGYNVHTRRRSGFQQANSSIAFDVKVTTEDGQPILDMEQLCLQRMPHLSGVAPTASSAQLIHKLRWTEDLIPGDVAVSPLRLVCWGGEVAMPLLAALAAEEQVTLLSDVETELGEPASPSRQVAVWCSALADDIANIATPFAPNVSASLTKRVLKDLMSWMGEHSAPSGATTRLVLTRGAVHVGGEGRQSSPPAAAVWAAAASTREARDNPATLVLDLDPLLPPSQQAPAIVRVLRRHSSGCFAVRGAHVHQIDMGATLGESIALQRDRLSFPAQARVLITGGAGGLGRTLAGWVLAEGVTKLRIASRNAQRATLWAEQVREADTDLVLELVNADIATVEGARASVVGDDGAPVIWDTVFHLAGDAIAPGGDQGAPDTLDRCLRPKLDGLLQLCEAWGDHPPRQLILFSSVAALNGSTGQPFYAAANAAFAAMARCHPRLKNIDLRICWFGPWDGEGMAGSPALREILVAKGLVPMPHWMALRGLRDVLSSAANEAIIALAPCAEEATGRLPTIITVPPANRALLSELVSAANPETEFGLLRTAMLRLIGDILEVAPDSLNDQHNLYELGFDSLMAIEFKHQVQQDFGLELSLSTMLEAGTINQLVLSMLPLVLARASTVNGSEPRGTPATDACFELVI
jgi:phthiocerol/phenolphthiocerol synthesis type-I polyketide synthase D